MKKVFLPTLVILAVLALLLLFGRKVWPELSATLVLPVPPQGGITFLQFPSGRQYAPDRLRATTEEFVGKLTRERKMQSAGPQSAYWNARDGSLLLPWFYGSNSELLTSFLRWNQASGTLEELFSQEGQHGWATESPDGRYVTFLAFFDFSPFPPRKGLRPGIPLYLAEKQGAGFLAPEKTNVLAHPGFAQWLPDSTGFLLTAPEDPYEDPYGNRVLPAEIARAEEEAGPQLYLFEVFSRKLRKLPLRGRATLMPDGKSVIVPRGRVLELLSFPDFKVLRNITLTYPCDGQTWVTAIDERAVAYTLWQPPPYSWGVVVVDLRPWGSQTMVYGSTGDTPGIAAIGEVPATAQ